MRYQRTFKLQAAHFNSEAAYKIAWALIDEEAVSSVELLGCLFDIHGHNFKIVVSLSSSSFMVDSDAWIVDDVALSRAVMDWDNRNLSMHSDFITHKMRATTEAMARVLYQKLQQEFGHVVRGVRVYESEDIFAQEGIIK